MEQNADQNQSNQIARRMPLWKSCLDDMLQQGVNHGAVFKTEFFEEKLRAKRDEIQFGISVSEIRRELEKYGYYISGQGQKSEQYVVLQAASHVDVMTNYSRAATDALSRAVILGSNTRVEHLNEQQRRQHARCLERVAVKAALLQRSGSVAKCVKKNMPKLLGE